MLIVSVIGFIFNLIQMKILHSGEGHYELGSEVEYSHGQETAKSKIKDDEVKKTLLDNEQGHQAEQAAHQV